MDDKSIDAVFVFGGYDADDNRNRRDSGVSRGDGCELERSAAQRAETNVIARSDDRATTNGYRRQLLRKEV
jgi:hypothetical protein